MGSKPDNIAAKIDVKESATSNCQRASVLLSYMGETCLLLCPMQQDAQPGRLQFQRISGKSVRAKHRKLLSCKGQFQCLHPQCKISPSLRHSARSSLCEFKDVLTENDRQMVVGVWNNLSVLSRHYHSEGYIKKKGKSRCCTDMLDGSRRDPLDKGETETNEGLRHTDLHISVCNTSMASSCMLDKHF